MLLPLRHMESHAAGCNCCQLPFKKYSFLQLPYTVMLLPLRHMESHAAGCNCCQLPFKKYSFLQLPYTIMLLPLRHMECHAAGCICRRLPQERHSPRTVILPPLGLPQFIVIFPPPEIFFRPDT